MPALPFHVSIDARKQDSSSITWDRDLPTSGRCGGGVRCERGWCGGAGRSPEVLGNLVNKPRRAEAPELRLQPWLTAAQLSQLAAAAVVAARPC